MISCLFGEKKMKIQKYKTLTQECIEISFDKEETEIIKNIIEKNKIIIVDNEKMFWARMPKIKISNDIVTLIHPCIGQVVITLPEGFKY